MSTIGQNIAYFRKQKKMTQEELAEKISVTAQAVSKWECDTSYPDITVLQTLSKILGVSATELLEGIQEVAEIKDAPQECIDQRIVRIEMQSDETQAILRFPIPVVKKAIGNGTLKSLVGEGAYHRISGIFNMVDSGLTGRLVEVNDSDDKILITVEQYED